MSTTTCNSKSASYSYDVAIVTCKNKHIASELISYLTTRFMFPARVRKSLITIRDRNRH